VFDANDDFSSDFARIEGIAAPLPIENLDTDQIMPKQFLFGIDKSGLTEGLLHDLRVAPDGAIRRDFVLNRPEYADARFIIGGGNFGCGSSREHAVWGLLQAGIRAVIASSFGEIFHYNAINNRLLTIALPVAAIDALTAEVANPANNCIAIDVVTQTIRTSSGQSYSFDLEARHKKMYLEGLDVLGASLRMLSEIEAFERRHRVENPWASVLPLASAH
jgi:3-isopropylmalate/(R)-2-methylmalate dehydratase small subunit